MFEQTQLLVCLDLHSERLNSRHTWLELYLPLLFAHLCRYRSFRWSHQNDHEPALRSFNMIRGFLYCIGKNSSNPCRQKPLVIREHSSILIHQDYNRLPQILKRVQISVLSSSAKVSCSWNECQRLDMARASGFCLYLLR